MTIHETSPGRDRDADRNRSDRTPVTDRGYGTPAIDRDERRTTDSGPRIDPDDGDATVGVHPNVIDVSLPTVAGGGGHVRLRPGDVLAEGDRGPVPGAIQQWRVTAVTPDLVAGRDRRTGASAVWDRGWMERQLGLGGMSTGLSEFVRVSVRPVWTMAGNPFDPPALRTVAYGDDDRRYERVYRPTGAGGSGDDEGTSPALELLWEDRATAGLPPRLRAVLDRQVAAAVADAGHEIRSS